MTHTLQNVVFPPDNDPDVSPLYADPETWSVIEPGNPPVRLSSITSMSELVPQKCSRVPARSRISYGTYFNAFPASYWQRWTVVDTLTLTVHTNGNGTLIIYRSNSSGTQQRVTSHTVTGECSSSFHLPLTTFNDGGWYWFDLIAADEDLLLTGGEWTTETNPVTPGKLSLGMTTYNKPDYCVATLARIANAPALLEAIDRINLVDQGTQKVRNEHGYHEVAARLGDKLNTIEQANIGGSGGFSRSMAETLKRHDTDFLLLLDDDVEFETESALRAHQFSRFSRSPILVGGHMFDLLNKPVMHAWAEVVRPESFMWGPSFKLQHRHDFRTQNLRQSSWMHSRLDADYNGWWMCMIPKTVIEQIGLALPVFIKWDDAEYGLRAQKAGFRTVSLPGMALWHVSWEDKDDTIDWQAFFHTRNRIITGLLHASTEGGKGMLQNMARQDIKMLLNMQYYAVQLAIDGMRAVLAGPHQLHSSMHHDMPRARARAEHFPETHIYRSGDPDTPVARGGRALPHIGNRPEALNGMKLAAFTARMLPLAWVREGDENHPATPELEYAKRDAFWWNIPHHRSVIIGTADGAGKIWLRHDRAKFRRLLREARSLNREIAKKWGHLAAMYRAALPQITSADEWQKSFKSH